MNEEELSEVIVELKLREERIRKARQDLENQLLNMVAKRRVEGRTKARKRALDEHREENVVELI